MKVVIKTDLWSGIFFLLLSVFLFITIPMQIELVDDSAVNSRSFPFLLALIIMVMSIKLIITETLKIIGKKNVNQKEIDLKDEGKALIIFLILLGYLILMPVIGYFSSSLIMFAAFLVFFRSRNKLYYIIALLSCAAVYLIFRFVLNVQLFQGGLL